MAEGMNSYSLADIAAMMRNNEGDGFLNGNGILIILFFLIFGGGFGGGWGNWGGNGWNNAGLQGSLTRSDLFEGFNSSRVDTKLDALTLEVNNDAHDIETAMLAGFGRTTSEITDSRYAMQSGLCETNRNIDALRYESARNTCDIIAAGKENTQRILDTMCQNTIQDLRDKVAEKDQMLQSAAFQISQEQQSSSLINALRPTPIPAYLTVSPYQSAYGYGYGYGNGGYYGGGYGFGGFGPGFGPGYGPF